MTQIINIGLGPITNTVAISQAAAEAIKAILRLNLWQPAIFELAQGPEEPTLAVTSRTGWSDDQLLLLCGILGQDCIAVLNGGSNGVGHLVGPNTEQYEPFDINKFRFGGD